MKVAVICCFFLPGVLPVRGLSCLFVCSLQAPLPNFPVKSLEVKMTCLWSVLFCLLRNKQPLFVVTSLINTGPKLCMKYKLDMTSVSCLFLMSVCFSQRKVFLGEFFFIQVEGQRTENVACCKAPGGKLWFVILGWINKTDWTKLQAYSYASSSVFRYSETFS